MPRPRPVDYPPPPTDELPLHRAARVGDHDAIRQLVASGTPVDEPFDFRRDPKGRSIVATPLMIAAGSGDGAGAETVRLLLELGASIDPGPEGVSALSFACGGLGWNGHPKGDADRIAVLLDAGADPNVVAFAGQPALASVARSGDPARLRLLLDAGADPDPDLRAAAAERRYLHGVPCHWLALHQAATSGSLECVRMLLRARTPVRDDGSDHSALACATSAAIVVELLAAGANPREPGPFHSSIVREVAMNRNVTVVDRTEMLRTLKGAGVDLDADDAIAHCAMAGSDGGVEALLAAGADPRVRNALACACFSYSGERDAGIERVIDLLIAAGFAADEQDGDGYTPLHQALSPDAYGDGYQESDDINVAAAAALIRHGASIDIVYPNFEGYGPLHVAALQCSAPAIELLLAAGADPAQRAPGGETPLDVARAQLRSNKPHRVAQAPECVRLLMRAGQ